jgi:hypothetical protein
MPHWWRPVRTRRWGDRELCAGPSMIVYTDTAADLREALEAEADRDI